MTTTEINIVLYGDGFTYPGETVKLYRASDSELLGTVTSTDGRQATGYFDVDVNTEVYVEVTSDTPTGWNFYNWYQTVGGDVMTSESRFTFTAKNDPLVYCMFTQDAVSEITPSATSGGTITPSVKRGALVGDELEYTAAASSGSTFSGFKLDDSSTLITTNPYTLTLDETTVQQDHTIQAVFTAPKPVVTFGFKANHAHVGAKASLYLSDGTSLLDEVTCSDSTKDAIETYSIDSGTSLIIKYTGSYKASGWKWSGWQQDGTIESQNESYGFDVDADTTIYAWFEYVGASTITFSVNDENMGSFNPSGGKTFNTGLSMTCIATPNTYYKVDKVVTDAQYTRVQDNWFKVTWDSADHDFQVVFTEETYYKVTPSVNDSSMGSIVVTGGSYDEGGYYRVIPGADAVCTATANSGYTFDHFLIDGATSETANPYTFGSIGADHTIQAVFTSAAPTVTFGFKANQAYRNAEIQLLNASLNPVKTLVCEDPTVDTTTTYQVTSGTIFYLWHKSVPEDEGYVWKHWLRNDGTTKTSQFWQLQITESITVYGLYENVGTVDLVASVNDSTMGSISPTGTVTRTKVASNSVKFTATANDGYSLKHCLIDGTVVTGAEQTLYCDTGHTIQAVFEEAQCTITFGFSAGSAYNGAWLYIYNSQGTSLLASVKCEDATAGAVSTYSVAPGTTLLFTHTTPSDGNGWLWKNWQKDGTTVTSKTFMETVQSDMTLYCLYENVGTVVLTPSVNDSTMGSISPSSAQTVTKNASATTTFTATAASGHSLTHILLDGSVATTESTLDVAHDSGHTVKAVFESDDPVITFGFKAKSGETAYVYENAEAYLYIKGQTEPVATVTCQDPTVDTTVDYSVAEGTEVTLKYKAEPTDNGWKWKGWQKDGTLIEVDQYSFTVSESATFYSIYEYVGYGIITFTANDPAKGTVSVPKMKATAGMEAMFFGYPSQYHSLSHFVYDETTIIDPWYEGIGASITFEVGENHTLEAVFVKNADECYKFTVVSDSANDASGTIDFDGAEYDSSTGKYLALPFAKVTMTGVASTGSEVQNLILNGEIHDGDSATVESVIKDYEVEGTFVESGNNVTYGFTAGAVFVGAKVKVYLNGAAEPSETLECTDNTIGETQVMDPAPGSGDTVRLVADVNEITYGYVFDHWVVDGGTVTPATTPYEYSFTMGESSKVIYAIYTNVGTTYIDVSVNDESMGKVNYMGRWSHTVKSDPALLIITAYDGYEIVKALVDGVEATITLGYMVAVGMSSPHTLHVIFTESNPCLIDASVNDSSMGSLSGTNCSYDSGNSQFRAVPGKDVVITANPTTGYKLSYFVVDGAEVEDVTSYTFSSISTNHTLVAVFVTTSDDIPVSFGFTAGSTFVGAELSAYVDDKLVQSLICGSTSESEMTQCLVKATKSVTIKVSDLPADIGWVFSKWIRDGTEYTDAELTFTPSAATEVHAVFTNTGTKTITASVNDSTIGSISPNGATPTTVNEERTFFMNPKEGYMVESVILDGETSVSVAPDTTMYQLTADDDHTLQAVFATKTPTITFGFKTGQAYTGATLILYIDEDKSPKSSIEMGGSALTTSYTIARGTVMRLSHGSIPAKNGWMFKGWQQDDGELVTSANLVFTAKGSTTIYGIYEEVGTIQITTSVNDSARGSITASKTYTKDGGLVGITANNKLNYCLDHFLIDEVVTYSEDTPNKIYVKADANHTIQAVFESSENKYILLVRSKQVDADEKIHWGTVEPLGYLWVADGSVKKIRAKPDVNHTFSKMSVNGVDVGTITPTVEGYYEYDLGIESKAYVVDVDFSPAKVAVIPSVVNGTISPSETEDHDQQELVDFSATADDGYDLSHYLVNGETVVEADDEGEATIQVIDPKVTAGNTAANMTVLAVTTAMTHLLTIAEDQDTLCGSFQIYTAATLTSEYTPVSYSEEKKGYIIPSGGVVKLVFNTYEGFIFSGLYVDNELKSSTNTYVFNCSKDHTIKAVCVGSTGKVIVSIDEPGHGSISISIKTNGLTYGPYSCTDKDERPLPNGSSATIVINADDDYICYGYIGASGNMHSLLSGTQTIKTVYTKGSGNTVVFKTLWRPKSDYYVSWITMWQTYDGCSISPSGHFGCIDGALVQPSVVTGTSKSTSSFRPDGVIMTGSSYAEGTWYPADSYSVDTLSGSYGQSFNCGERIGKDLRIVYVHFATHYTIYPSVDSTKGQIDPAVDTSVVFGGSKTVEGKGYPPSEANGIGYKCTGFVVNGTEVSGSEGSLPVSKTYEYVADTIHSAKISPVFEEWEFKTLTFGFTDDVTTKASGFKVKASYTDPWDGEEESVTVESSGEATVKTVTLSVPVGLAVTFSVVTLPEGRELDGWYDGETKLGGSQYTMGDDDVTIYAKLVAVSKYSVSAETEGGGSGTYTGLGQYNVGDQVSVSVLADEWCYIESIVKRDVSR